MGMLDEKVLREDLNDREKEIAQEIWDFVREISLPEELDGLSDAEREEAFDTSKPMDIYANFETFEEIQEKVKEWDEKVIKQNNVIENTKKAEVGVVLKKVFIPLDDGGFQTKYSVFTEGGVFEVWDDEDCQKTNSDIGGAKDMFSKLVSDLQLIKGAMDGGSKKKK